jgi:hypothetical protein
MDIKILESFRNNASYAPGAGRLSISSDTSASIALDIPTVVKFHAVKLPRTATLSVVLEHLPLTSRLGLSRASQSS